MNWLDRILMLAELVVLLRMLQMDTVNSQAIQRFLKERELWYSRRAHLRTMQPAISESSEPENKKAPNESEPSETVELLKESENEQNDF